MKLYRFLNDHLDEILSEWVAFARTLEPAADSMSVQALRDHAKDILLAIASDFETRQNAREQYDKSRGNAPEPVGRESAASTHGALRQASDFSLLQLSSEFRALRATVLRMWLPQVAQMTPDTVYEMVRFNEAIDQALAESVVTYSARAEHMRELFLAILGHDLRAPLFTMSLVGELLAQPAVTPEQVQDSARRIRRSSRLMKSMVADLLGYTSSHLGGGMPMQPKPGDLRPVCESALEDARATHPDTRFEFTAGPDLQAVFDAVRLHQLLINLLVNAGQYGEKDHPVLMDARIAGEEVVVTVTNAGPPIPAASQEAIFKPLVQLPQEGETDEDARPRTSLGLGLFIAREIALAQGGQLTLESNEAAGTVFTARFPRSGPPQAA
ncbi:MAG: ATP-binding protein [Ramlibacter sp.]